MIKETAVSTILYYLDKNSPRYLLGRDCVEEDNYWSFIRGRTNDKERLEQTAKRVVFDDSKLKDVNIIRGFKEEAHYKYKKDNKDSVDKRVVYLLSQISKQKSTKVVSLQTNREFLWVGYNEAIKLLEFSDQRQVLEKANLFLEDHLKS